MLEVTGMLCSRHSTSVQDGRRFLVLASKSEKFNNEQAEVMEPVGEERPPPAMDPADPMIPEEDGGSLHEVSAAGSHNGAPVQATAADRQYM
jgi:hypothetical protein